MICSWDAVTRNLIRLDCFLAAIWTQQPNMPRFGGDKFTVDYQVAIFPPSDSALIMFQEVRSLPRLLDTTLAIISPKMYRLLTETRAPPSCMSPTGVTRQQMIHSQCISLGSGRPAVQKGGKLTINLFLLSSWPTQDRWCCQRISCQWCIFNVL